MHSNHPTTPHQELGRYLLEVVIVLALLVPTVSGPADQGLVRRFLRHPVMAYLGMISYGIYLWHYPVLVLIHDRWFGWGVGKGSLVVVSVLGLALTLVVASASWYVLERPLIRWSQRPSLPGFRRKSPESVVREPEAAPDPVLEPSN